MPFGTPNIASAGVAILPDFGSFRGALNTGLKTNLSPGVLAAGVGLTGLVAASGAFADKAADAFLPFENTLSRIVGLAGVAEEQVQAWSEQVLVMGPRMGKSAQELAEALQFIASSGFKGAEAMDILEQSAMASVAGLGQTATVADAVTSAISAYGPAVLSAAAATDILVATVREGKAEAASIADGIGKVIPIAAQMGVEFEEVGGAIAAMTLRGLGADEAFTGFRGILVSFLNPSLQAEERLEGLGLSFDEIRRSVRDDGLLETLLFLQDAFRGNEEAISDVFDDVRALTGFLNLVGAGADQTAATMAKVADFTGDAGDAFGAVADDEGFKMKQALEAINVEMIKAGQQIVPSLVLGLQAIGPVITNDIIPAVTDLVVSLTDLATNPLVGLVTDIATTTLRGLDVLGDTGGLVVAALQPWNQAGTDAAKAALFLDVAVNNVIDAMANARDPVAAVAEQMAFLARNGKVSTTEFVRLAAAGRLTSQQMGLIGQTFLDAHQAGQDLGLTTTDLLAIFRNYIPNMDMAVGGTDGWAHSMAAAGDAAAGTAGQVDPLTTLLEQLSAEGLSPAAQEAANLAEQLDAARLAHENLADVLLAAANPFFAAVQEFQSLQELLGEIKDVEGAGGSAETAGEAAERAEQLLRTLAAFETFNQGDPASGFVAIAAALGSTPAEVKAMFEAIGFEIDQVSGEISSQITEAIIPKAEDMAALLALELPGAMDIAGQGLPQLIIPVGFDLSGLASQVRLAGILERGAAAAGFGGGGRIDVNINGLPATEMERRVANSVSDGIERFRNEHA